MSNMSREATDAASNEHPSTQGSALARMQAQVQDAISAEIAQFEGRAAMLARNLDTGEELAHDPDAVMPTASTIKVVVLAELLRQVDAGLLNLDAPVTLLPEDRRGGSGILKDLSGGVSLTLRDHAVLMIALSDNTSTAVCVRLLGLERIMQSAHGWGMTSTSGRITTRTSSGSGPAREYAASSPRDLTLLLQMIAEDRLVSAEMSATARDILLTQQYLEQLARYLPYQPYARIGNEHPGPLLVYSKSGFMRDDSGAVRVDAGIIEVRGRERWVICCMTEGSPDEGWTADHPGSLLNARISRLVYDAWATP